MRPDMSSGRMVIDRKIYVDKRQKIQSRKSRTHRRELNFEELEAEMMLGLEFLKAAQSGSARRLQDLFGKSAPVNFTDPTTGATALHYVAAYAARPAFRVLLKTGQCDFLIRDRKGRLASELAGVYGHDLPMERLLLKKEIQQARAQGIDPTGLYKVSARKPAP